MVGNNVPEGLSLKRKEKLLTKTKKRKIHFTILRHFFLLYNIKKKRDA
jgi:hypothetical protein